MSGYGKIVSIEEIFDHKIPAHHRRNPVPYDGYCVTTDSTKVMVLIESEQNCCENWGYATSEDNLEDFVGATLLGVEAVDTQLKAYEFLAGGSNEDGYLEAQFVNLETDNGLFQIAVYNAHNGYYGHQIRLIVGDQVRLESSL